MTIRELCYCHVDSQGVMLPSYLEKSWERLRNVFRIDWEVQNLQYGSLLSLLLTNQLVALTGTKYFMGNDACALTWSVPCYRVPRGSVVRLLTRNPGVLGSSRTRSSGVFFVGVSLSKTLQSPAQPSTGETQENINNVSCRRDMTEILLKAA